MADELDDVSFEKLIRHIQESRGIDFRGYKRTSLRRRITLRMEQVGVDGFAAYHALLEADPREFGALLNTVLINVTSFFRDPHAWEAIKQNVLPKLLVPVLRGQVRIWSVGCASGEEPYSLAMLFAEALGTTEFARRVKIYATDLDEAALDTARHAGVLAPRHGKRAGGTAQQILRAGQFPLRRSSASFASAAIFGRHNIVDDAPISRIDLLARPQSADLSRDRHAERGAAAIALRPDR